MLYLNVHMWGFCIIIAGVQYLNNLKNLHK